MNAPNTALRTTLDVYDVAQLTGGLDRVVETAVVTLLGRGRLAVDEASRLQAVGTAPHPVEAAVLELAGPRPRRTIATLRFRAGEDPRLTAIAERLVTEGLLRRNPLAGLPGSWPAHLRTAAGRRELAEWRAVCPAGRPGADVALGGPAAMADRVLAESVFGTRASAGAGDRRPGRRADVVGMDSGTGLWATGWGGWGGGWGGDGGGGFGGGDGGGCGGGDGGGGGC
jgi:hypothetical protein